MSNGESEQGHDRDHALSSKTHNTMRSRSRSRSPSHSSSRSRSPSYPERGSKRRRGSEDDREYDTGVRVGTRVHVGSLSTSTNLRDLREEFRRFGEILDMWMAKTQPCFAFIVYRTRDQALKAIKRMDGETVQSRRIRVTMARPRTKGTRSGAFNPYLRCYQCGKRGHFSRACRAHQWSPNRGNRGQTRRERYDRDSSKRSKRRSGSSSSGHRKA
ncbi:uncharacterized protein [Littorina saxatilis]|uniref:uncharacterized protein isoform X2 n=1 Tax=Littorina saxatilis TaxID=31220 RepID=UPI0038B6063C